MAQTVTFDMYVRTNNVWQQYERFIELERDDALQTAQQLDLEPEIEGVRIIRVTAFGTNRAPLETLEWISPSLRRNASRAKIENRRTSPSSVASPSADEATTEAARERNQKKSGPVALTTLKQVGPLALKSTVILVLACALSVALFTPAQFLVNQLSSSEIPIPSLYQEIAAFSICAVVFLILAGIGFYFFVSADDVHRTISRQPPKTQQKRPQTKQPAVADPEMLLTDSMMLHAPEPEVLLTPDMEEQEPLSGGSQNPVSPFVPTLSENLDTANSNPQENEPPEQALVPIPTGLDEKYRISMLRFLEGSLSELTEILKTLDQYSLFGINLFLGGAGDQFGAVHDLNGIQRFILIRETISALGTQPDMVDVFCEKFTDYDKDPNYRFMTESGRTILDKYLAGDDDCFSALPDLIKRWRKSNSAVAQAQGIVVIMFTDLVGSTQMTHDHGDLGAQQVVRAHNAIVRNALAQFHGEEVKHTGDGIMASFANAPNSLRAAIRIQREISSHNSANPQLPVRVRIGLNAGDAVREEDDFFGQAVQLAARICDKADESEIYITPSVQELCVSHAFELSEAGRYALKGIDEPVTAYAVGWQQSDTRSDTQAENEPL